MKKSLFLGSMCCLVSCAYFENSRQVSSVVEIKSGQTKNAELDELDPRFEKYWKDSKSFEEQSIQEVGKIIGDFVKASAETKKKWFEDYQALLKIDEDKLTSEQKKKLAAYEQIFKDLPANNSGSFATRDVHRKDHGCYKASVKIDDQLDGKYTKGLFQRGEVYDAIVRFSNGNPNDNSDYAPDARGMAVKLIPQGTLNDQPIQSLDPKVINSQGLLDILTINFPTFFVNDAVVYAKVNSYFLANKDDVLASKKWDEVLSVIAGGMTNYEKLLALRVNGSVVKNLLYQEWFSMAPSRLGEFKDPERTAVKYMIEPCNMKTKGTQEWPMWSSWEDGRDYQIPGKTIKIPSAEKEKMEKDHWYLRNNINNTLKKGNFCYAIYLQPYLSEQETSIEDTTKIWHWSKAEKASWLKGTPSVLYRSEYNDAQKLKIVQPIKIGQLTIKNTGYSSPGTKSCENLSFNPWNNVPDAHKPLGVIQRIKRAAYHASRTARFDENKVPHTVKD